MRAVDREAAVIRRLRQHAALSVRSRAGYVATMIADRRMRRSSIALVLAAGAATLLGLTGRAHAHATYNVSGYGSGLAGSTNGADGSPTAAPAATWTNGPPEGYAGALPATWYCGLHNATQVRTIQTGLGAQPPSGSLLDQVTSYNASTDPDLLTDMVLAVGGLSWTDPANGGQGWGHGLDYGLVHVTPLDTIQADGPVSLTITLADDPSDGVEVRLAYAIYGGWDTSSSSVRHQTFTTSPSPVSNPLGSSGLTLIDYAVATTPGTPLSRTYDLDPTYDGHYTILVGALDGVAGQYQLTAGLFPTGAALNQRLTQCTTDLSSAQANLATMTSDGDADGVPDQRDSCQATPVGQFVDQAGCSQAEFCGNIAIVKKSDRKACIKADWKNDEPTMTPKNADCAFDKKSKTCGAKS
jgi:hypothetical protein